MLHLHDLDHVQVNGTTELGRRVFSGHDQTEVTRERRAQRTWGRRWRADCKHSIDHFCCELFCERRVDFCGKGSVGDIDQGWSIKVYRLLERVQELRTRPDEAWL